MRRERKGGGRREDGVADLLPRQQNSPADRIFYPKKSLCP